MHPALGSGASRGTPKRRAICRVSAGWGRRRERVEIYYSFSSFPPHLPGAGYPLRLFLQTPLLTPFWSLGEAPAENYSTPTRHPALRLGPSTMSITPNAASPRRQADR